MSDESAFRSIYDQHCDMVYNLCLNYLQNSDDAQEVTQDVFVSIYKKLDNFRQQSSLKTWIYRIAINKCLDFLKAQKRQKRFGFHISIFRNENEVLPLHSAFKHPGIVLEQREDLERLLRNINTLPSNQKTALLLKAIDGLPQKEIAEIMGTSLKAVESLLSRAKANLKKILDQSEGMQDQNRLKK